MELQGQHFSQQQKTSLRACVCVRMYDCESEDLKWKKSWGEELYKTIVFVYKIRLGFKQAVMDAKHERLQLLLTAPPVFHGKTHRCATLIQAMVFE